MLRSAIGMRFEIQDGTKIIAAERRALVRTELFDLSARTSDQYIVRFSLMFNTLYTV